MRFFVSPALHRGSARLLVAVLLAACSEPAVGPVRRSVSLAIGSSRNAVPVSGRHVFLFDAGIPGDFESRVRGKGGRVERADDDVALAVTEDLSDADASIVGKGATVVHDFTARWVPTPEELRLSADALSASITSESVAGTSLQAPQLAAYLPFQWPLRQIQALDAWNAGFDGNPSVRVAILDSGLDPRHLDQASFVGHVPLIDQASSIAFETSKAPVGPAWGDDFFHGTFVGGIVTSNNVGTAGVVPNVTLIAVKVLTDSGKATFSNVLRGILHAAHVHANIANMSLGAYVQKSDPETKGVIAIFNRVMSYAHRNGVLLVSSSGNENVDLQHTGNVVAVPCEVGVGLCVSATTASDERASYSNYGSNAIDLAAPGGDGPPERAATQWIIGLCSSLTTLPALAGCTVLDPRLHVGVGYIWATGTSASAPFVSGLAAYLESQPGASTDPSQVIAALKRYADDLGKPGTDPYFGKGRINVLRTLSRVTP